jgi:hypothetical protein
MDGESGLRRMTAWIPYVFFSIVPGGPGWPSAPSPKTSGVSGFQSSTSRAKKGAGLFHAGPRRGSPWAEVESMT